MSHKIIEKVNRFITTSLNTWTTEGFDAESGDFIEALSFEGKALSKLPRRGRVQARQILSLAMAHCMNDDASSQALNTAEKSATTGLKQYLNQRGALIAKIDRNVKDKYCFAYEQAFLIMAYAWLYQATKNETYRQSAEHIWQWLEDNLTNRAYGGFNICLPDDAHNAIRQQNPHMHLFEACLICAVYLDKSTWLARAKMLFNLFERHFYDSVNKCVLEFFTQRWQPHPEKGDQIEPGHHFEWVWLLSEYEKLSGVNTLHYRKALFHTGITYGINDQGFACDALCLSTLEKSRTSARLWVECELLKAYVAMNEAEKATELVLKLFESYLIEAKGIWYDQLSQDAQNISKNAPASTFYHLYIALNEYRKLMLRSVQKER